MSDITANVVVSMPNQLFTLARSFKAASGGKIYIGQIDTDPVNPANQIQVYLENEDGSHVPVMQPIIINAAGYPVYNGQISKFVTVQGHSMAIYDAYGSQQFYFPNVLKYDPDQFKQILLSPEGGSNVYLKQGISVQDAINKTYSKNTVYIENFLPAGSTAENNSNVIDQLIGLYPNGNFVFGQGMLISRPIKYPTYTSWRGFSSDRQSVIRTAPGFSGNAIFEPVDKSKNAVQNVTIENLLLIDGNATADSITLADGSIVPGRGTTSNIKGIDITGTFNARIEKIAGSYLDSVVYAAEGSTTIQQTTSRTFISRIDANQCNYLVDMPGRASANNYCYGDITVADTHTTGSIKYGLRIMDADGAQIRGLLGFASFQIKISGTQLTVVDAHPFDPKAQITDTGQTAESIYIAPRAGGGRSSIVHIIGVTSTHAGRLADTTIGNPAPNNKGAFGIKCVNVDELSISATVIDPSQGALYLDSCWDVNFDLNIRRVNTQNLGSGAYPSGTYSSIYMSGCINVKGNANDRSPERNYFLESYASRAIDITGNVGRGATLGRLWLVNDNMEYHRLNISLESGTAPNQTYSFRTNGAPNYAPYNAEMNSATPTNIPPINDAVVVFNNNSDTRVTDIPSVGPYQTVTISIRDNGATKLRNDVDGGGKFKGISDFTQGRGTILRFMRDPDLGLLVKI
uniref:phage head-binding domain-containing protein n=1 Tax=Klebsiella aerogenes TaxID=548 RepID=UPI001F423AD3|nr:phage head-binding domain-containing protein [Klebsiella aerogenes]